MFIDTRERPAGEVQQKLTISDVLSRAADLIEQRGWCRWIQEERDGSLCIAGAIAIASGGTASSRASCGEGGPLYWPAIQQFIKFVGVKDCGPAPWNNDPDRTKSQVLDTLRAAAK